MVLFYERINWENFPSIVSPINEINLNKIDYAAKTLDERTVELYNTKAEKAVVLNTVQDWSLDEKTGIITITKVNGEQIMFDLNIEKIPVKFELSEDGILTMTTEDGSKFTANIGAMIPVIVFENSDTISVTKISNRTELAKNFTEFTYAFDEPYTGNIYITPTETSVAMTINLELTRDHGGGVSMTETRTFYTSGGTGDSIEEAVENITSIKVSGNVDLLEIDDVSSKKIVHTFSVKDGSIKDKHLEPNYLAKIKVQAENAELSATASAESATTASEKAIVAESYAVGGTGTRDGEDTDNAKYYAEQAKETIESLEFPMPISKGGTGGTTAKAAQYNLLKNMNEVTTDVLDTSEFVCIYNAPTAANGAVYSRTALTLWNYIKSKAESIFATKTEVTPVANLATTVAGKPLDATMGKELAERLTALEGKIEIKQLSVTVNSGGYTNTIPINPDEYILLEVVQAEYIEPRSVFRLYPRYERKDYSAYVTDVIGTTKASEGTYNILCVCIKR